jgi:fermentation-respiration switch protein FrsA (DUF1100 family)
LERLYVFRPSKDVLKTPTKLGIPYDQCFVDTADGCRLSAWNICPENPVGSIVYFHGNGGNLGILVENFAMLYRHRLQVFAVDYRGYGWSTGLPTEDGVYSDALAAIEYFNANFRKPGLPVVYWGRSLGGCVAAYAAGRKAPNGLILETTFPSKTQLLRHFPHIRPFRFFSRYRLDTIAYLIGHQFPVLIIHGDKDRTIPIEQGKALYEQLTGPKQFFLVEGAGHIDTHMLDSQTYMEKVLSFVEEARPAAIH